MDGRAVKNLTLTLAKLHLRRRHNWCGLSVRVWRWCAGQGNAKHTCNICQRWPSEPQAKRNRIRATVDSRLSDSIPPPAEFQLPRWPPWRTFAEKKDPKPLFADIQSWLDWIAARLETGRRSSSTAARWKELAIEIFVFCSCLQYIQSLERGRTGWYHLGNHHVVALLDFLYLIFGNFCVGANHLDWVVYVQY